MIKAIPSFRKEYSTVIFACMCAKWQIAVRGNFHKDMENNLKSKMRQEKHLLMFLVLIFVHTSVISKSSSKTQSSTDRYIF